MCYSRRRSRMCAKSAVLWWIGEMTAWCVFLQLLAPLARAQLANATTIIRIRQDGNNSHDCAATSCQSLEYALTHVAVQANVVFSLDCGEFLLENELSLSNFSNIAIVSDCPMAKTTLVCANGSSLAFHQCSGIDIVNVAFKNCGPNEPSVQGSALMFNHSRSVVLTNVTVLNSTYRGITFLNTFGTNNLTSVMVDGTERGSGLYFEFENSQCHLLNEIHRVLDCNKTVYVINESVLRNCKATTCTEANASSMGGGMAIVFRGSVSNVQVTISESEISDNEAMLAGGGAFVGFLGSVESNTVFLLDTKVLNNTVSSVNLPLGVGPRDGCEVGTSGGGVAVLFSDLSQKNNITFLRSTIVGNAAHSGGGLAATFQGESLSNVFTVRLCDISRNTVTSVYDNPCVQSSSSLQCTGNGGGLAFAFTQEATSNIAEIYSSNISHNSYTEIGGGYSVVFYDSASSNTVQGILNVVDSNRVTSDADMCESLFDTRPNVARVVSKPSGGGACLLFLGQSSMNSITLNESFSRNTAVRGGGLFVAFYNLASRNNVVTSGLVHDNWLRGGTQRSRSGGGAMVEYRTSHESDRSSNTVRFSKAIFLSNNCSHSFGGAVAILYVSPPVDSGDEVSFGELIFSNNSCRYGRAIASTTVKRHSRSKNFNIVFLNSTVLVNVLEDGFKEKFEELDRIFGPCAYPYDQDTPHESIEMSIRTFTTAGFDTAEFYVRDLSDLQELLQDGQGIIYLRSVTMRVETALVIFCGGLSQGIFAIDSIITFSSSSNLTIEHCISTHGGAMAFYGNSFLSVSSGARLTFSANRALQRGGAIYARTSPADVSRVDTCFLQYSSSPSSVHPAQWNNVSLLFVNNTADAEGSSVYLRDGLTCLPLSLQDTLEIEKSNILRWENVFTYSPSCGPLQECTRPHVASGPNALVASNNETISRNDVTASCTRDRSLVNRTVVSVSPGNFIRLPIGNVLDIFNNNSTAGVLASISTTQNNAAISPDFDISIDGPTQLRLRTQNGIKFKGRPFSESNFQLENVSDKELPQLLLQALSNRDVFAFFRVTLDCCPPGFQFNESSRICQCDRNGLSAYLDNCEVIDGFQAKLKNNYWFGYQKSAAGCGEEESYYSHCPLGYCSGEPLLLPSNRSREHLDELICGSSNRKGTVCGQCKEGYGVPINFNPSLPMCQDCQGSLSPWGVVVWILSEWVPMLAVVVIILLFNVDVLNGRFHAFLLSVQLLPLYLSRGLFNSTALSNLSPIGRYIVSSAVAVCQLWNFQFFSRWLAPFCLSPGSTLSVLQVLIISFFIGLAPLCLVCLFVLADRLAGRCCKPIRDALHATRNFKHKYCGSSKYGNAIPTTFMLSYSRLVLFPAVMVTTNSVWNVKTKETMSVFFWDGSIGYFTTEHNYYWIPVAVTSAFILLSPTMCLVLYPALPMMFDAMKNSKYQCLKWVRRLKLFDKCVHGLFSVKWIRHFLDVCQSSFKPKYRIFASFFLLQRDVLLGISQVFLNSHANLLVAMAMLLLMSMMISIFQPYRQQAHNAINLIVLSIFTLVIALNLYRQNTEINVGLQMLLVCSLIMYITCIIAFAIWKLVPVCVKELFARAKTSCTKAKNSATVAYRRPGVCIESVVDRRQVAEVSWRARDGAASIVM